MYRLLAKWRWNDALTKRFCCQSRNKRQHLSKKNEKEKKL